MSPIFPAVKLTAESPEESRSRPIEKNPLPMLLCSPPWTSAKRSLLSESTPSTSNSEDVVVSVSRPPAQEPNLSSELSPETDLKSEELRMSLLSLPIPQEGRVDAAEEDCERFADVHGGEHSSIGRGFFSIGL